MHDAMNVENNQCMCDMKYIPEHGMPPCIFWSSFLYSTCSVTNWFIFLLCRNLEGLKILIVANVQESTLCFGGIEFLCATWFFSSCFWQLRLQFCEQAIVVNGKAIAVGVGGHHCEHSTVYVCFRTYEAFNHRRWKDCYGCIRTKLYVMLKDLSLLIQHNDMYLPL